METSTYNGWTNRATWLTALWLDSEYSLYKAVTSMPEITADAIKEFVTGHALKVYPGFMDDMKTTDINAVNWVEVADSFRDN